MDSPASRSGERRHYRDAETGNVRLALAVAGLLLCVRAYAEASIRGSLAVEAVDGGARFRPLAPRGVLRDPGPMIEPHEPG